MNIESERKDSNGVYHMRVSGRYGIYRDGSGYNRDALLTKLTSQVMREEMLEFSKRQQDDGGAVITIAVMATLGMVLCAGVYLVWLALKS